MKKFVVTYIFLISVAFAQNYSPDNINKKAIKLYGLAMEKVDDGNNKLAIEILREAIELDTNYIDAQLSLAGLYGETKDYIKAVEAYEIALQKDSIYSKVFRLPYAINLGGLGRFEEALFNVNIFLGIEGLGERSTKAAYYRKRNFEFALQYKTQNSNRDYTFNPINLGDSINTDKSEYFPSLAIADSLLIFTRRTEISREDFYKSTLNIDSFSLAEEIGGSLNDHPFKGAVTVSSDGEWLIFAGDYGQKGYGNYDLYISYRTKEGWSEPENLGRNVNTEYWESAPSLSPDNRVLYFCSDRAGGFGGRDLYMCVRQANGRWSIAENMGQTLNSNGDDLYPYIHADNQTLYFTSNGHQGYGNSDLFISRKDFTGRFAKPENLGYPINTIDDEGSITVSSDGKLAYYASDKSDSKGGLDIYKFELRDDIKPFKTLYVRGQVIDAKTQKGIPCTVELFDNNNTNALMKIQADELGKYFIPLPFGKDYTFIVNRKGYLFYSALYELSKQKPDSTYTKNIVLNPIQLNSSFTFNNVEFKTGSYELLPSSLFELNKLVQILQENPNIKIEVKGHTDNVGKATDNIALSTNRAKAVAEYLFSKNLSNQRIFYKGFGSSKPIGDNATDDGKAKNRRTEFEVIAL